MATRNTFHTSVFDNDWDRRIAFCLASMVVSWAVLYKVFICSLLFLSKFFRWSSVIDIQFRMIKIASQVALDSDIPHMLCLTILTSQWFINFVLQSQNRYHADGHDHIFLSSDLFLTAVLKSVIQYCGNEANSVPMPKSFFHIISCSSFSSCIVDSLQEAYNCVDLQSW